MYISPRGTTLFSRVTAHFCKRNSPEIKAPHCWSERSQPSQQQPQVHIAFTSFSPLKSQGPFSPPNTQLLSAVIPFLGSHDCSPPPSAAAQPSILIAVLADCTRDCAVKSHMSRSMPFSLRQCAAGSASPDHDTRVTDLPQPHSSVIPSSFYLLAASLPTGRYP